MDALNPQVHQVSVPVQVQAQAPALRTPQPGHQQHRYHQQQQNRHSDSIYTVKNESPLTTNTASIQILNSPETTRPSSFGANGHAPGPEDTRGTSTPPTPSGTYSAVSGTGAGQQRPGSPAGSGRVGAGAAAPLPSASNPGPTPAQDYAASASSDPAPPHASSSETSTPSSSRPTEPSTPAPTNSNSGAGAAAHATQTETAHLTNQQISSPPQTPGSGGFPTPGKQQPSKAPAPGGSAPNPTRSSWVWNFFVQTPDNPFRVQCQFHPAPDSPEICGVILTRDKTGSTGSMCRHLSRVHQLVPTHTATVSTGSSKRASFSVNPPAAGGAAASAAPAPAAPATSPSAHSPASAPHNTTNTTTSANSDDASPSFPSSSPNSSQSTGNGSIVIINGVAYTDGANGLKKLTSPNGILNNKRLYEQNGNTNFDHPNKRANTSSSSNSNKLKSRSKSTSSATLRSTGTLAKNQSKFTPSYILNNILPYYIETGIVFYEPDFYRFKAHLLSTLQISTLPTELQSYANFCLYAQTRFQSTRQSIKRELANAPGLISLCCGIWKHEDTNATPSTRHIEHNMMLIVTARYVDANWTLRRLLLKMIPTRWYTTSVVSEIQKTALEYDISGRIFTIGIDGSNHNLAPEDVEILEESLRETAASGTIGVFKRKPSVYTSSLIPRNSLYYGLDEELGELQFDCGVDRRSLVFDSLVSSVSKLVDDLFYKPASPVLFLIMKLERVADEVASKIPLRQQMDKIVVKEVTSDAQQLPLQQEPPSPQQMDFQQQEILQLQRRSERKTMRDYDDDDDEEDYEDTLKRLDLDGEFNNCNKDGNDELVGWRSVFVMLKNTSLNLDAIKDYATQSSTAALLSERDTDMLQAVVSIVQPIFTTISDLKISSYDTAGVTAFAIETMIKSVLEVRRLNPTGNKAIATSPQIAMLVNGLEKIYRERINDNMLYSCIAAMDPNFKRVYWHMDPAKQSRLFETLRKGVLWVNDRRKRVGLKTRTEEEIAAANDMEDDNESVESEGEYYRRSSSGSAAAAAAGFASESAGAAGAAAGAGGPGPAAANSASVTWNDILPSPVRELNEDKRASREGDVAMEDSGVEDAGTPTRSTREGSSGASAGAPSENPASSSSGTTTTTATTTAGPTTKLDEEPSFFRNLVSKEMPMDSVELEIGEYLRVHTGTKFVDPYQWWQTKGQQQFPQLSKLAMTYLAIAGWNTVVHNQQLYEGSAVLPCQRRRGRHQLVVKSTVTGVGGTQGSAITAPPAASAGAAEAAASPDPTSAAGTLMKLNKEALAISSSSSSSSQSSSPSKADAGTGAAAPLSPLAPAASGPPAAATTPANVVVLEKIRPEQEMCLRYWTRYYHTP